MKAKLVKESLDDFKHYQIKGGIKSLEGAPKHIGGIKSLEGAPKHIGKPTDIQIKSLERLEDTDVLNSRQFKIYKKRFLTEVNFEFPGMEPEPEQENDPNIDWDGDWEVKLLEIETEKYPELLNFIKNSYLNGKKYNDFENLSDYVQLVDKVTN